MHEDPKASALARTTRTRTNAAFAFASVVLVAACFLFLYYVCSTLWSLALGRAFAISFRPLMEQCTCRTP